MDERPPETLRPLRAWFAALGGALAWALHMGARYPLVQVACEAGAPWVLHVVTGIAALGVVASFAVAFRLYERTRPARSRAQARLNFMARAGLVLDPLFLLVILAELLPALLQDPCL